MKNPFFLLTKQRDLTLFDSSYKWQKHVSSTLDVVIYNVN